MGGQELLLILTGSAIAIFVTSRSTRSEGMKVDHKKRRGEGLIVLKWVLGEKREERGRIEFGLNAGKRAQTSLNF